MSVKAETNNKQLDWIKWLVAFLLIIIGVAADYYYQSYALAIRVAVGIVLVCVAALVALQTSKGQFLWGFVKGARIELQKVVWPSRKETLQVTLMVAAMVFIMALILWGADTLFIWLVSWLSGQRG